MSAREKLDSKRLSSTSAGVIGANPETITKRIGNICEGEGRNF